VDYAKEKAGQAWEKLHPLTKGKNERGEKICTCRNCILSYQPLIDEANGYTALALITPDEWTTNEDSAKKYYYRIEPTGRGLKIVWNYEESKKGNAPNVVEEEYGDSDDRPLLPRKW
jgi:hypothetical protein